MAMSEIVEKTARGGQNQQVVHLPGTRMETLYTTVETGIDENGNEYEKRQAMAPRTFEKCVIDGKGATLDKKLGTMQSQINSATTDIADTMNTLIGERTNKDVATKDEIKSLQNELNNFGRITRNSILLLSSGWYRIYKLTREMTNQHFTLIIEREFNMNPDEAYILDVFTRYNGSIAAVTINSHISQRLITKIRFVTSEPHGLSYIDLFYEPAEPNTVVTQLYNTLNITDVKNMYVEQAEIPEGYIATEYIIGTTPLIAMQQNLTEIDLRDIEMQRAITEQELNNIEAQQELTEINLLLLEKEST